MILGTQEWTEAAQGVRAFVVLYAIEDGYECESCGLAFQADEVEPGERTEASEDALSCPVCDRPALLPTEIVVVDGEALTLAEADDDLRAGRRG